MLAVYINKVFAEGLEHRELHGHIAHKGATLTRRGDNSANGDLRFVINVELLQEVLEVKTLDIKESLDYAVARVVLNRAALISRTKQQRERSEKDTLAGTGLSGDDVEL